MRRGVIASKRGWWIAAGLLSLSGCLVDFYGGAPRLQVVNNSGFTVWAVGIGNPADSVWTHSFDPLVRPGQRSAVVDLPVAGRLRLWIRVADSVAGWDTLLTGELSLGVGDSRRWEVSGDQRSRLSTSP